MRMPEGRQFRISVLAGLTALTLATHYGWVVEPVFGHVHWFHVLHGRFCYIPIVVAASWFGLRGGLYAATIISALVLPFIFGSERGVSDTIVELVEIVFYYFLAILIGALVDREFLARRRQQKAVLQVERSQKLSLVGQVAAGVAHEIKNPLTSIKGAADILADDQTSPQARREFKEILQKEVRRIDSTVTEFLTFARPRETRLEKMNLSDTVRSCVKQLTTQARPVGIEIEEQIADNVTVIGDAEKIHQLTLNLVLNAIQASQAGDTVRIGLAITDQGVARIEVVDSGVGIDEESISRVFEPFFTTKASGAGLGLATVKSIVDSHNGKVRLQSVPNEGTTVTVDLPLGGGEG